MWALFGQLLGKLGLLFIPPSGHTAKELRVEGERLKDECVLQKECMSAWTSL